MEVNPHAVVPRVEIGGEGECIEVPAPPVEAIALPRIASRVQTVYRAVKSIVVSLKPLTRWAGHQAVQITHKYPFIKTHLASRAAQRIVAGGASTVKSIRPFSRTLLEQAVPFKASRPVDLIGIVTHYFSEAEKSEPGDQFTPTINREITTISLNAQASIQLLDGDTSFPNLHTLAIIGAFDDGTICALAESLNRKPRPALALELRHPSGQRAELTSATMRILLGCNLTELSVSDGDVNMSGVRALGEAKCAITLTGPSRFPVWNETPVFVELLKLPTLCSVKITSCPYDSKIFEALKSNRAIQAFETKRYLSLWQTSEIFKNPSIKTFSAASVDNVGDMNPDDVAHHPALTSFHLENVNGAIWRGLVRNTKISTVLTGVNNHVLRQIAGMPSLRNLTLVPQKRAETHPLKWHEIEAVCEKRLDSLHFDRIPMEQNVLSQVAGARASALSFIHLAHGVDFDQGVVTALLANPYLSSLTLAGPLSIDHAISLAVSDKLTTLKLLVQGDAETVAAIRHAWQGTGKLPEDLLCQVYDPSFKLRYRATV